LAKPNQTEITSIYNGEIVAGSLLIPESRKIAELLLEGVDKKMWHRAVVVDNVLQKRSIATAKRQAKLIRNRLTLMTSDIWELIINGSSEITTQALLAASIKHSRLLGDFMDKVIRDHHRIYNKQLTQKAWDNYFELCARIDPVIDKWSETTKNKLGQVVFRVLAEAKYIDNTKSRLLLPVAVTTEIKKYLVDNDEDYVLRCMEVNQQ